ncbi:HpcH/HpaI aldolase/citrate lyase family protein [Mesorhizobium sp. VNQ89]|uniref:HpcH/HpaI aldolase family protein n=1 Tax=Mesorhizobium quangtriensis TaxID=3157709 RepID=UPI0032B7FD21
MSLGAKLAAGETVCSAWSGVPDALTVEILASQGFDAVTLDMQHGGHNEDSVLRSIIPVLRLGKPALVRVPVGRFDMASRALDFGAEAVIAPMINTIEDAQRFAAAMKYPPVGERSWGPTFGFPRHGKGDHPKWLRESNTRTLSFAMIETRAAVDILDRVLDTPGIDAIFLGPSDFSIAWTNGERINSTLEDMMPAIEQVAGRARRAGKYAGIYVVDPSISGRFVSMGYQLLAMGQEMTVMKLGSEVLLKAVQASLKGA